MKKNKLDITPELALSAARTLIDFCKNSNEDCVFNGEKCPFDDGNCMFMDGDMPDDWKLKGDCK